MREHQINIDRREHILEEIQKDLVYLLEFSIVDIVENPNINTF